MLGICGLVLWKTVGDPDLAIIFSIRADVVFGLPTLIKTYKNPYSETLFPWLCAVFSGLFSLFAISYISFTEIAYPIYLLVFDFALLFIIFYRRGGFKDKKE